MGVVTLHWPGEEERRRELARAGVARLLIVSEAAPPPISVDPREDWVRATSSTMDIDARINALLARSQEPRRQLYVDDDGVLRVDGDWVPLPPVEARLLSRLIESFDRVVSREDLAHAGWPDGSPGRNALDVRILRLRRRIESVGLSVRTIRSRGYLLERRRSTD